METTPISSSVLAVQIDKFTLINYNNSFMASVITMSAVIMIPPAAIHYSFSLFVSPKSLSFILLFKFLLIEV